MLSDTLPMPNFEAPMASGCLVDVINGDPPLVPILMDTNLALFPDVIAL